MKNATINTTIKKLAVAILLGIISIAGVKAAGNSEKCLYTKEMKEENIQMENWMTNLAEWNLSKSVLVEDIETEDEIAMEDWMLNPNDNSWELAQTVDEEQEMEVEKWMINLKKW